jgi:undecaprenyl-diphosphatase
MLRHRWIIAIRQRFAKQTAFVQARLSARGCLGLRLMFGALVLIGATWIFAAIGEDVWNLEPLTLIDAQFSAWLHAHTTVSLTRALLIITNLHSTIGVSIITLTAAIYLSWRRERYWLLALCLSVFGGMLLNLLLKSMFHRVRPHFDDPILTLSSYSFPSGHTMMATVLYGTLAMFAVSKTESWLWRLLAIIVAALLILLVGFSRVYLGAHYLSDVLGAMVEGLGWLGFCLTAVAMMQHRRLRA